VLFNVIDDEVKCAIGEVLDRAAAWLEAQQALGHEVDQRLAEPSGDLTAQCVKVVARRRGNDHLDIILSA
jgi:hypothetical protein